MTDAPLAEKQDKPKEQEQPKKDPLSEIFGPGTSAKLIGGSDDQIPDEVRAVLDMHGLAKRGFTCMLKSVPEGASLSDGQTTSSESTQFIKGWTRSIPSLEFISKNYGPGLYILGFTWRAKIKGEDGEETTKVLHEEIPIEISPKAIDDYKQHRLDSTIKRASSTSTRLQEELVEKTLESQIIDKLTNQKKSDSDTAKNYIKDALETVKSLGIPMGFQQPQVPAKVIEWDKVLPALTTGLAAIISVFQNASQNRQSMFDKLLLMLLTQNQGANSQLVEVLKMQAGVGSGASQIKEITDMVLGAVDLKNALKGEPKETVADKIFNLIESVAPHVINAATAARAGRPVGPMADMAKGYIAANPDFKTLQNNPEEMKAFITKMDNFYGWRQTDMILEVAGWQRPEFCPRDPVKEHPPKPEAEAPQNSGLPQHGTETETEGITGQ